MPPPRTVLPLVLVLALACLSCESPDPKLVLEVQDVETYWVVDPAVGATQYIAPAVRFTVLNKSQRPWQAVEATATFRRKGEEDKPWGSDFRQVTASGKALSPGEKALVMMRSDGRYYSSGAVETFFQHELFRDATVEVFLRVGASNWTSFALRGVDRRIGTKGLKNEAPGKP